MILPLVLILGPLLFGGNPIVQTVQFPQPETPRPGQSQPLNPISFPGFHVPKKGGYRMRWPKKGTAARHQREAKARRRNGR